MSYANARNCLQPASQCLDVLPSDRLNLQPRSQISNMYDGTASHPGFTKLSDDGMNSNGLNVLAGLSTLSPFDKYVQLHPAHLLLDIG